MAYDRPWKTLPIEDLKVKTAEDGSIDEDSQAVLGKGSHIHCQHLGDMCAKNLPSKTIETIVRVLQHHFAVHDMCCIHCGGTLSLKFTMQCLPVVGPK